MKMTFVRFSVVLGFAAAVQSASADYLYCMIEGASYNDNRSVSFDYARLTTDGGYSYRTFYVLSGDDSVQELNGYDGRSQKLQSDRPDSTSSVGGVGVYADIGSYETDYGDYTTFLFELLLGGEVVGNKGYNYSEIAEYVYNTSDPLAKSASEPLVVSQVIPEPTSALLLLFGLAGLAIRRRKAVVSMLAVAFVGATFAAQNDALVTFSTRGPDTYADGATVMDGECYALVWSPKNATFEVLADGTTTGGEIVLTAPVARDGHCPRIVFQVPAAKVDGYKNGEWSVYLLDTRRIGANGVAEPAGVDGAGKVRLVNAAGEVAGSAVAMASASSSEKTVEGASCAAATTGVPANTPKPEIVAIRIIGENVYVTVQNAVPYLQYDLAEGETPDQVTERVNDPRNGEDDGTVVLVAPKKEGSAFFRVNRN